MPATHLSSLYRNHLGLMTDLYQLTMALGYWKSGLYKRDAAFNLFYRTPPFEGSYAVVAGLEPAIDLIQQFSFSTSDIQYLGSLKSSDEKPLFDESFLNYLQRMEFSCSVEAMPEGSIAFPHQPILRIQGPLIQCQLLETALLTLINFSTLIATKSSRIVQAAQGDEVLEFGMRRAQGLDGALTAARSAFIGGCTATSNVMAGKVYGIPVKGTHAHSWVMCFDEELDAFRAYANSQPGNCIFLVDTYNTHEGVRNAILVGKELRRQGHEILGIRLDSGDLAQLSKDARKMLDEAGFPNAAIVASNDLDEYCIEALKKEGATISVWGVGTRLATSHGQSALGGVYKLAGIQDASGQWQYRIKKSEQSIKTSNPGMLQVWRTYHANGKPKGDILYHKGHGQPEGRLWDYRNLQYVSIEAQPGADLLVPVIDGGKLVYDFPKLSEIQSYARAQIALFDTVKKESYVNGLSAPLHELKNSLMEAHLSKSTGI
jgi:nicotinate phosphoribosyltransferase